MARLGSETVGVSVCTRERLRESSDVKENRDWISSFSQSEKFDLHSKTLEKYIMPKYLLNSQLECESNAYNRGNGDFYTPKKYWSNHRCSNFPVEGARSSS